MQGERWILVPIGVSLGVVAGVLAVSVALSLAFPPSPAAVSVARATDEGATTEAAAGGETAGPDDRVTAGTAPPREG